MEDFYQEQPQSEGGGLGLLAGLVLVLAIIVLVYLVTRAIPGGVPTPNIDLTPNRDGGSPQLESGDSV